MHPDARTRSAAVRPSPVFLGIVAVAVWTGLSLLVHVAQVLQGLMTPRGQIVSWLSR